MTHQWPTEETKERVYHWPKCFARGDESEWVCPWLKNELLGCEQGVCHQLKDTPMRMMKANESVISSKIFHRGQWKWACWSLTREYSIKNDEREHISHWLENTPMGMSRKSNMYSTKTKVWGSMRPGITPSQNRDNIWKYKFNWMAQEKLHWGIMIK